MHNIQSLILLNWIMQPGLTSNVWFYDSIDVFSNLNILSVFSSSCFQPREAQLGNSIVVQWDDTWSSLVEYI